MDHPCWLLDLDGVVWRADRLLPGAVEAVGALRQKGRRVAFFTNNSFPLHAAHLDKLHRLGLGGQPEDLLSSPQAAAACCQPGEQALVLGGPGIVEALATRGVEARRITDELEPTGPHVPRADVLVAGIDPELTYRRLAVASTLLRAGTRFLATNDDATFPAADGIVPGAGAILAALTAASGRTPVIAGKPHGPAVELVRQRLGEVQVVVGDRPSTDGLLARRLGAQFALVHSGVTPADHGALDPAPDVEAADLSALVAAS